MWIVGHGSWIMDLDKATPCVLDVSKGSVSVPTSIIAPLMANNQPRPLRTTIRLPCFAFLCLTLGSEFFLSCCHLLYFMHEANMWIAVNKRRARKQLSAPPVSSIFISLLHFALPKDRK